MEKPKTFEIAVALNYAKGMSRAVAVKHAARDYPALHEEYLKRLAAGGDDYLQILLNLHDDALRSRYDNDPAIRKEFRNADAYVAYCRGLSEGRIGSGGPKYR